MSELDIRKRIKPYKLREIDPYITIVEHIRDYGATVPELVLQHLPPELEHVPERVREVFSEISKKRDITFAEIVTHYKNIPKIETLTRYVILYECVSCGVKDLRTEKLLQALKSAYPKIVDFIESPEYRDIDRVADEIASQYDPSKIDKMKLIQHLIKFAYGVRKIVKAYKCDVFEWIMQKKTYRELEQELRIFFPKGMTERDRRALRAIVRLFSHKTNIPIAIFLIKSGEYRKYISVVDMYTATTTMRSGAFLIMKLDSKKVADLEQLLKKSTEQITVRLKAIKGIVRAVAKLSLDPILYERGAFTIGYRYCSKGDCENCPIRDVCKKFKSIIIK